MPPRGARSAKRVRQYEHIKESEMGRRRNPRRAKEIGAATVGRQRSEASETKRSTRRRSMGSSKTGSSRTRSRTTRTTTRSSSRKRR